MHMGHMTGQASKSNMGDDDTERFRFGAWNWKLIPISVTCFSYTKSRVHALTMGGGLYVFQIVGNDVAADFQVAHNRVAR